MPLRIALTHTQAQLLEPLFDRCRDAAKLGLPGMLVAQPVRDSNGDCYMRVGWLPNAKAQLLVEQATHAQAPDERPIPPGVGE